jgi:chromosome segregation ATPase
LIDPVSFPFCIPLDILIFFRHNPESPNGKTRFKRVLNVKSVKNAVFVDGIQSDQEEYRRRLRDFNIQPENLTQFLPQDRVSDIVDLKKEDLLLETEQAVCWRNLKISNFVAKFTNF